MLRAWAACARDAAETHDDFGEALGRGLAAAREALAETPRQLATLARNHVVDAGGQGFVYFLEGISEWVGSGHGPTGRCATAPTTHRRLSRPRTRASTTRTASAPRPC